MVRFYSLLRQVPRVHVLLSSCTQTGLQLLTEQRLTLISRFPSPVLGLEECSTMPRLCGAGVMHA